MAMKVTKTNVHRLTVTMSCGCKMFAEFRDPRYKEPVNAPDKLEEGQEFSEFIEKSFTACKKHENDQSLSMLEFILGERFDEAVEEAGKAPIHTPESVAAAQQLDPNANGIASGAEAAQTMGMGNKLPKRDPLKIKTAKMAAAASGKGVSMSSNAPTIDMEGVPEDPRVTALSKSTLGFLLDKDEGLEDGDLEDEDE